MNVTRVLVRRVKRPDLNASDPVRLGSKWIQHALADPVFVLLGL